MMSSSRTRRTLMAMAAVLIAALGSTQASTAHAAGGGTNGGTSVNGFLPPVLIPTSTGLGEPTLIHDSQNRLFVTAPQKVGNVNTAGGSPVWTSTALGANGSWSGPVSAQENVALSGGDTDLATDGSDDIFQTDLWLGSSALALSTDHGASFTGNPFGSEIKPGDDRPWIAYGAAENRMFFVYDGLEALQVAATAPLVTPQAGLQVVQDQAAIPESIVSGGPVNNPSIRECVCPPGGIAVDNSTGSSSHPGRVYISYSHQGGTAVAYSDPVGTCPAACTAGATGTWTPVVIPGSGSSGSPFENEWNFDPIKVDSNGTVYVMWAHGDGFDGSTATGGVEEDYASSTDGGNTWNGPFLLSTAGGGTTTFPTMDVVSPGVIDVAWYGNPTSTGDPNAASGAWNLYYTRVTGADTATPTVATPMVAIQGIHNGCIQVGGGASCPDRSLLDFFQLTDTTDGVPNIIYAAGDATNGTDLFFTRLSTPASNVPETPWAPLLLVPGVGVVAAALGRRRLLRRPNR